MRQLRRWEEFQNVQPLKQRLATLKKPINVAVIGIGSIGSGVAYQSHNTPNFKLGAISDIRLDKAEAFAKSIGLDYEIVESVQALNKTMENGKVAVCQDGLLASGSEQIDAMVECTSAVYAGARHAEKSLQSGQHVAMMNFEAELMYGPYLLNVAKSNGRVYTCADGDQPTVIKTIIDEIDAWGFETVMMGNMKGFLDPYTNPEKIAPEADKRGLDHKMCSSYSDGSKLCVEMASLANAMNGRAYKPGMSGPSIKSIHDIFGVFDFGSMWKSGDRPFVDYVLDATPKGGVFVIGYNPTEFQNFYLSWFPSDMGPGPFYLFYRPYHLGHIESLRCLAEAYMDGTARLHPRYGMKSNVFAYAKKDLNAGDEIDGMGGYVTYGLIENLEDQGSNMGTPQLISDGMRVKRAFKKDERIPLADVEFDENAPEYQLYQKSLNMGEQLD